MLNTCFCILCIVQNLHCLSYFETITSHHQAVAVMLQYCVMFTLQPITPAMHFVKETLGNEILHNGNTHRLLTVYNHFYSCVLQYHSYQM